MKNVPIPLKIQRELVDEGKDIHNTAAGEAIDAELNNQIRRQQADLMALKEEMEELKEKDRETRRQLEEEKREHQEKVEKMEREKQDLMAGNYQKEKQEMMELMKQVLERIVRQREEADAAHRKEMENLTKQLKEIAESSAAQRDEMQKRINELQHWQDSRGGCLIM
jgi:chromosome segregation ATPase